MLENYQEIHRDLKVLVAGAEQSQTKGHSLKNDVKDVLVIFAVYEVMILLVVLSWAPVIFYISGQEKNILGLLRTMNLKELKKTSIKLKYLY